MKLIKKIMLFSLIIFGFVFSLNLLNVEAATAPDTIKLKSKSNLYYFTEKNGTDYISGYNFYRKELTDGTLAYCVSNISKGVPAGKTLTLSGEITDKGLAYIILNGYPNKNITGDSKKDYYITQAAIWKYFDETRGSKNWKNTTFSSDSSTMKREVYFLVQGAKTANSNAVVDSKPSITPIYLNDKMTLNSDSKYFVSDPIKVSLKNTTGTYTVKLVNAPTETIIKSQKGEVKNTFNNEESFLVYTPKVVNTSGTITLQIEAKNITYKVYEYKSSSSSYQNVAPITKYETVTNGVSDKIVLKYVGETTKVKISKQDIASKEEVAGATLVINDKTGKEIERWVSTNEPHYIEGLVPGEYTLTETIAPNGYVLSNETVSFTVKADGEITSVVMYNAKEEKTTKVKISKQDIASKEEVAGATLVIKDKTGKEIEKWVSTNESHYIEGLAPGEYTLTETIAPNGYVLSDETVSFTVKADGEITSVVMYNTKYVEVPITDLNINKMTIVFAAILMISGLGLVGYYAKREK